MSRVQNPKKFPSRISNRVELRIIELSQKNPDFGARRLTALMKSEKIGVSESTIYNVLKRHDLQTREKRLAKINGHAKSTQSTTRKPSVRITDETAEHIVEVSMQHPECGARRHHRRAEPRW